VGGVRTPARRGSALAAAALVLLAVAGCVKQDNKQAAYDACVTKGKLQVPGAEFGDMSSAQFSGNEGNWGINGTYTVNGTSVSWVCQANKMGSEDYTATFRLGSA
jgi:hypothetical protein